MKDADCRVIAKVKMNDKQTVYGGFTADHFVWHADSQRIAPFGLIGQPATDSIYTLATDCELVKTVDGTLFTPISNTFCAEDLDWATYVQVFRALQAFVSSTSSFWRANRRNSSWICTSLRTCGRWCMKGFRTWAIHAWTKKIAMARPRRVR
eukprot:GEMP01071164.1.p1 GENE.GEMP01071164.1~~GEMP01071164.1.p1  ORF type:complete len:152 (+),score=28.19 GEMP01071164.1:587-1042(+)